MNKFSFYFNRPEIKFIWPQNIQGEFNHFKYFKNLGSCVNETLLENLLARCEITY